VLPDDRPDRGRAVPRRARRLAGLHPLAVRRAGARPLGAGDRGADARAARHRDRSRCTPTTASCCGCRTPARRLGRRPTDGTSADDPGAGAGPGRRVAGRRRPARGAGARRRRRRGDRGRRARPTPRCSPAGSASAPPGPCCCPSAGPAAHPAVAAAPARRRTCWPSPAAVRVLPDRAGDLPRVPAGRLRRARPAGAAARHRQPQVRITEVETEQAVAVRASLLFGYLAGYMYEGDAPLAERGPRRWRWTASCWPSCWAPSRAARPARPRRAGRPRARAAAADPDRRAKDADDVARPAAGARRPAHRRGRGAHRRPGRRLARPSSRASAASTPPGSRARSAGPPSRTPPGCATRSACRAARRAPRRPRPAVERPDRSTWSPATPAPTGRSPPTWRRGSASASRSSRVPSGR
jgi:hypothetical protein